MDTRVRWVMVVDVKGYAGRRPGRSLVWEMVPVYGRKSSPRGGYGREFLTGSGYGCVLHTRGDTVYSTVYILDSLDMGFFNEKETLRYDASGLERELLRP